MKLKATAVSLALAAAVALAPFSAARAQTAYEYPYYANPLFWPFLAAGAVLGTAALIVTAPVRIVCWNCLPPAEAFYPFYVGPAYPPQPAAYQPGITYSYPAR